MNSGRVRIGVGIGLVVVLIAVAAVVLIGREDGSSEAVRLEPAADPGPDPFTESVTARELGTLPDVVAVAATEVADSFEVDDATGTLVAAGTTPGLYGGTRNEQSCDPAALATFLADSPDKAAAWAGVLDIDVDEIPSYLSGLTPVLLTADTLVTNHGFAEGRATPRQTVLQAGTAVLVDDEGTPRVRCSCGNPLTPPAEQPLADATLEGDRWPGYEPEQVTVVQPGEPADSLTLIDIDTGEQFDRPVGSGAGGTWIAVSGSNAAAVEAQDGKIHTSPDGVQWSVALDTDTPLRGVAVSADLAVVVGNDGRGGVVHTSADGATWSPATTVIDPLIAVAHGDGRWVAVGDRSFAEEGGEGDGSAGAIYSSTDGTSWERVATTSPYDNTELTSEHRGILYQQMVSVAFGDGQWIATARECAEQTCQVVEFTSTDTTTWTRKVLDGALTNVVVAHDGAGWGFVGTEADAEAGADSPGGVPANVGVAGTSEDGTTWSFGPTEPDRVTLEGLSAGAGGWLAVHDTAMSLDPVPTSDAVYRSDDLATWTELSTVDADLHGIAVFEREFTTPTPAATTTTVATTTPVDTSGAAGIRVLTRGLQFVDAAGMNTTMSLFAEPATSAVSTITAVLGAPERTVQAGDGTCVAESVVLRWGALRLIIPGTSDDGADWQVFVQGTPAELPAMPVTVPGEFTLGSSADEVAGYFPGVPKLAFAYEGIEYQNFLLDPTGGEMDPGTRVGAENGTVRTITAPDYLEDMC